MTTNFILCLIKILKADFIDHLLNIKGMFFFYKNIVQKKIIIINIFKTKKYPKTYIFYIV